MIQSNSNKPHNLKSWVPLNEQDVEADTIFMLDPDSESTKTPSSAGFTFSERMSLPDASDCPGDLVLPFSEKGSRNYLLCSGCRAQVSARQTATSKTPAATAMKAARG